ncbi:single-stranded-DNA-specific exonuclease [Oikeobacillus pervagus]|uniref:Single-stranded-DNA-specific exonuclease RecJ n=1 Tax=Oikeobacillus pervagus TaxID=1325931 RepID=A0AAJ1WIG6_9BACI|nr:single-stranded-DNA-specific exonuclease RecJ [Oikeobacillus pervagus]MDQ0214590.1 single-stranded-DNA-specific exonuclease [Oikeobacillus pervagus]
MLKSKTRWIVRETKHEMAKQLSGDLKISPLLASLLINRGMSDTESARYFLFEKGESFHDPFLLKGMDVAVERIKRAIENNEQILIFGDYDADGVSSTSVMMTVLTELGANVEFYIPNRFTEGYGPNEGAFRWAHSIGVDLIITVDTGIAAIGEAGLAKELGIDLIITDHHEPGPELPEALAIIHPKHPEGDYPFPYLAGVGVAFKVAHALYGKVPYHLLDLVAIGTIADLVPLIGENRSIAKAGLKKLQQTSRPGIRAMCKVADTKMETINEETIGFMLAPRLNAVGRLDSADPAVELLLTQDEESAKYLANEIDQINKERQAIVQKITEEAIEMVESQFPLEENSVLVIGKEGWNSGVIGIVASRLVEKYYRPTIVLSYDVEAGLAKGSARSIAGFDLFKNLSSCRELLPHFGGHPMAAGMTLNIHDVEELRERLNRLASEQLSDEDFIPLTELDASIELEDVQLSTIEELQLLAPFGMKNPKPKILLEKVSLVSMRKIGTNQTHLKLQIERNGSSLDGIGFGMGEYADQIAPNTTLSCIGELSINEWNNICKPQIFLQDIKVDHWQLFDMRGNKPIQKWIHHLPSKRLFIVFNEETMNALAVSSIQEECVYVNSLEKAKQLPVQDNNLIFLDLPSSKEWLEAVISKDLPERIYAYFYQNNLQFFHTIPTRNHFKWYYAFLMKRKSFDLKRYGSELAKYKGWTSDTVSFMSKVFFELDFVTIENGFIRLNQVKQKRDLSESFTYQQKQQQFELENELLYSPYHELKNWFDHRMGVGL